MPRGAEEGQTLELDSQDLHLVANKPVSFRLYSSLTRVDDPVGRLLETPEAADLHLHAPLNAVIRFGKSGERLVPVKLRAHLTEVGTLEVWADSKISEHHWRLQFELRKTAGTRSGGKPAAVVSDEALAQAEALLEAAFRAGSLTPEELPGRLEQALALGRNSWPLSAIRKLGDRLLELAEARRKSPALEMRWLNLCGFMLRPGFGFPGDDFRIEQARRIYAGGIQFANQVQNEIDWWIFWGRVAGGLNKNQQVDIFQRLSPVLLPRGGKRPRINNSLLREMWRTGASLELLPLQTKTQLGDALLAQVKKGEMVDTGLWCLSRLGARKLFYGPINQVLPVQAATRWVEALLKVPKAEDAVVAIARRTGDSTRDLSPATLGNDPQADSGSSLARARRRSRRGSRQSVWRRAAVGLGRRSFVTAEHRDRRQHHREASPPFSADRRRLRGDPIAHRPGSAAQSRSQHRRRPFHARAQRRRDRRAGGGTQLERYRGHGRNAAVLSGIDGAGALDRRALDRRILSRRL